MGNDWSTAFAGVIIVLLIFYFILLIVGLVCYILMSIGIMKMAENKGISNPWLAWIPIGNLYIMGELVTKDFKGKGGLIYMFSGIGYAIFYSIFIAIQSTNSDGLIAITSIFSFLIIIAFLVINIMFYYKICKLYTLNPILHTILGTIIVFYMPILFFVIRNRTSFDSEKTINLDKNQ